MYGIGFVPNAGTTLISEGIGDFISVFQGLNRNFTWGGWATGKAFSLAMSLGTFNFGQSSNTLTAIESVDQHALKLSKQ